MRIAIVLRYKDDLFDSGTTTVEEHNKILRKRGKVWLGKFGLPIKPSTLRLCVEPDVEASIILVRAKRNPKDTDPRIFVARLSEARNSAPQSDLIPSYYRKHLDVDTWFCVTSEIRPMKTVEAQAWVALSSGEPLLLGIRNCPRTFFLVTRRADVKRFLSLLTKNTGKKGAPDEVTQARRNRRDYTVFTDDYGMATEQTDFADEPSE